MNRWKERSINWKFLDSLRRAFGRKQFTNKDAYQIYRLNHWRGLQWHKRLLARLRKEKFASATIERFAKELRDGDPFMQMTVRNCLCAAAQFGYVKRLAPGKYKF